MAICFFWDDRNILELGNSDGSQLCGYSKKPLNCILKG